MLRYVCDRCKKVIFTDGPSIRLTVITADENQPDKEERADLCSDCSNLFKMFMSNKESDDSDYPIEMSLAEDKFECPRCYTHYVFEVTEDRRIHVLYKGSNHVDVKTSIITHPPFVNFNCPICNLLLKIPESVLKEVNK